MQPVLPEDLLEYSFLSEVAIAPDGERAAFIVRQREPRSIAERQAGPPYAPAQRIIVLWCRLRYNPSWGRRIP